MSLGINLQPDDGKICSFDCLYCEAGYNAQGCGTTGLPSAERVSADLEAKLLEMAGNGQRPDVITFSGNGEPTLHPRFPEIVDRVLALRDRYAPGAKVSVLTNSTRIFTPEVAEALKRVDNNILKLDSAIDATMRLIDRPADPAFTVERLIEGLRQFSGTGIIQTMLLRGSHDGHPVDNTTPEEIAALINAYKAIRPASIMLYSLDRSTPEEKLVKVEHDELEAVATVMRKEGLNVTVS